MTELHKITVSDKKTGEEVCYKYQLAVDKGDGKGLVTSETDYPCTWDDELYDEVIHDITDTIIATYIQKTKLTKEPVRIQNNVGVNLSTMDNNYTVDKNHAIYYGPEQIPSVKKVYDEYVESTKESKNQ